MFLSIMKNFSIVVLLFGLFLLAGCTNPMSTTSETTDQIQDMTGTNERIVGNTTCDNYLHTIQCFSEAMTGSDAMTFKNLYTSLLQSFKDVPNAQLEETCTNLSSGLRTHPTILKDYPDCNKL